MDYPAQHVPAGVVGTHYVALLRWQVNILPAQALLGLIGGNYVGQYGHYDEQNGNYAPRSPQGLAPAEAQKSGSNIVTPSCDTDSRTGQC